MFIRKGVDNMYKKKLNKFCGEICDYKYNGDL